MTYNNVTVLPVEMSLWRVSIVSLFRGRILIAPSLCMFLEKNGNTVTKCHKLLIFIVLTALPICYRWLCVTGNKLKEGY
jgi:hypothetical protein